MLVLYNLLIHIASPFLLGYYAGRARLRGKELDGFQDRMGFSYDRLQEKIGKRPVIWIHAVSVGEVLVAAPFIHALQVRYPGHFLLVTTVTSTGRAMLQQRLPEVEATRYFPLDLPIAVNRALNAVRPALFVALETEIWPNFIAALKRRGIPAGIVNGRISPGSFSRYRRIRWFMRGVLARLDFLGMQTREDADRITAMGGPADRVTVMGNMKYDGASLSPPGKLDHLKKVLGYEEGTFPLLWVAGSTHAGEEAMVLEAYRMARVKFPHLKLAIAPRHPERFSEVAGLIEGAGFPYRRLSEKGDPLLEWKVLLVDTLGDLQPLYSLAAAVFVGGSLVPTGGHNVMEPAAWGKPVLFGPHMFNFADAADRMLRAGCGVQVRDVDELARGVIAWLENPQERDRLGEIALSVVRENRGAVDRAMSLVNRYIRPSTGSGRTASQQAQGERPGN